MALRISVTVQKTKKKNLVDERIQQHKAVSSSAGLSRSARASLANVTCKLNLLTAPESERPHSHRPDGYTLGLVYDISKLHRDDYVGRAESFRTSRDWKVLCSRKYRPGWRCCMNLRATVDTRLIITSGVVPTL